MHPQTEAVVAKPEGSGEEDGGEREREGGGWREERERENSHLIAI